MDFVLNRRQAMSKLGEFLESLGHVRLAWAFIVSISVAMFGAGLTAAGIVGVPARVKAVEDTTGVFRAEIEAIKSMDNELLRELQMHEAGQSRELCILDWLVDVTQSTLAQVGPYNPLRCTDGRYSNRGGAP